MTMLRIDRVKARQRQMYRRSVIHRRGRLAKHPAQNSISPSERHDLASRVLQRVVRFIRARHVPEGARGVISSHWLFQSPGPTSSVLGAGTTGTGVRAIGTRLSAVEKFSDPLGEGNMQLTDGASCL